MENGGLEVTLGSESETYPVTPDLARLNVQPSTPVIGAEIDGVDLAKPLSTSDRAAIIEALDRWKVVFFRDQKLSNDQLVAFGSSLGPLTAAHPNAEGLPGHPEIWERSVTQYRNRDVEVRAATDPSRPPKDYKGWHIDISFAVNPVKYSILYGVDVPSCGGDTLFSSLSEAYNGLSADFRSLVDGLDAVHQTDGFYQVQGEPRRTGKSVHHFSSLHPLTTVHPSTGERLLFINPSSITHLLRMSERESRVLLDFLFNEVSRPQYSVRHRWQPGSVVLWDNRAVVHAGPIDYVHFEAPRIVRRVTVEGEIPVGVDGRRSRALDGEPWIASGNAVDGQKNKRAVKWQ